MKTTFFHDTTFIKENDKYYTLGPMNSKKFSKYEKYFGKITAVVKVIPANNENKKTIQEKNLLDNIEINGVHKNYKNCMKIVKEQIKKTDFAIIRMPSIIGIMACKEARKNKIPYMIEMVGCPRESLWYHGGIKYKIAMPIITLINKIELKKSKNTIYVTEQFLQKRYPTKGKSINCSDVEIKGYKLEILEKRKEKIKEKKADEIFKLGLIGSLDVKYKGHETAIKAISKLKDYINLELHFLGAGNKENWIKMAEKYNVEKNIFFDGILPHEKVNEWIDELDIFLMPSMTEGLPRSLIEAMSRGCPVIGSDVGGIPELISKEYIFKKGDFRKLADYILELCKNKERMIQIAEKNFDRSMKFTQERLEKNIERYYKEIVKEIL